MDNHTARKAERQTSAELNDLTPQEMYEAVKAGHFSPLRNTTTTKPVGGTNA